MKQSKENGKSRAFQWAVTAAGVLLWAVALADFVMWRAAGEQLILLALVPLAVIVGMFPLTFPLPAGLKFTNEKVSFTLSDAFVMLVACWYGALPAVFLAGLEGFVSSRSTVRRLSSNLFSAGMMSLSAAAAALCIGAALVYAFARPSSFTAVACALLAASVVHLAVNVGLLSTLLALRHDESVLAAARKNILWSASMFLPTSTAASLMYLALHKGFLVVVVVGAPVLLTVYFIHRQYRDGVRGRIEALATAHRQTVEALAVAINAKDEVTHEHVVRVQTYAAGVARLLGCTEAEVEALKAGALLHDIGKIAVPDHILSKPGKLTAEEFNRMKLHTVVGAQILSRVEFPFPVVPVVRHHHERWDGRGYPEGLKGEAIPLTARILSVVDCFDAVREDRQYRKAMTREEAVKFILEGSGTFYDPRVVGTFLAHLPEFEAEIEAQRHAPAPTFGIEAAERLSEAALEVAPAAGLAQDGNASPHDQQAVTAEEQRAIAALTGALEACGSEKEKLASFAEHLAALVPYDTLALTRAVNESGGNRVVHAAGRNASLLEGRSVPTGSGVTGWAISNRQPICNSDPKLDLPPDALANFEGYRTLAVFPLTHGKETFGAVTLYAASHGEYDLKHQRLLREAAEALAHSLSHQGEAHGPADMPLKSPRFAVTTLESNLTH